MIYFADINLGEQECHGHRVHCDGGDHYAFMTARAERWSVRSGWFDCPYFQLDLVHGGGDITRDYASIPANRVKAAQQSMRERAAQYALPHWHNRIQPGRLSGRAFCCPCCPVACAVILVAASAAPRYLAAL